MDEHEAAKQLGELARPLARSLRIGARLDADEADEAVQEALLCLWTKVTEGDDLGSVSNLHGLAYRVAQRVAAKHRQSDRRRTKRERKALDADRSHDPMESEADHMDLRREHSPDSPRCSARPPTSTGAPT